MGLTPGIQHHPTRGNLQFGAIRSPKLEPLADGATGWLMIIPVRHYELGLCVGLTFPAPQTRRSLAGKGTLPTKSRE